MKPTLLLSAVLFSLVYLSRALPQYPNDGSFIFDTDYDFQGFVLPTKPTVKAPQRAGKPRAPLIASLNQQNVATPVPILKQINRHNENGSYTYGFESADGSFKIETKLATGEVIGKYGYVDDKGKLRVVEYGANKYGFQPAGEGITIPPITLANETEERSEEREHYAPKPEVIRILSKPANPKRKSQHKPIALPKPQPIPQYSVQEPDESTRSETIRPIDLNTLQFIFGGEQAAQWPDSATFQTAPRRPVQAARDDRPPFIANFPIQTIFDVVPLPAGDFPQSRAHHIEPVPKPTKPSKNRAKPKHHPPQQLVLVTPADEITNPVRRSSNGVRVVHEGRSILDELMKQYAIPNGSPAISDFSFSYNTK